ncbi:hypothetical protein Taro_025042 [Colocasia esculenta]|uniref:NEDD8 ultimate buster 1 n=1 Tax=Colocasia esculenta TaxID=4460 RepID=A0A843VJB7_COLES|nr:hypothetical protein [Colocasia esculenta]
MESEKTPAKLRVAGLWCGALEGVALDTWTIATLKEEISRRAGGQQPPDCINLISAGKVLRDDGGGRCEGPKTLLQLGLKNNSKVLASAAAPSEERSRAAAAEAVAVREEVSEAERSRRLARIRAAAEKLSQRHVDGCLPVEDYDIELENQAGEKVMLGTETDQRAVMMGLMLHANGKKLLKLKKYQEALDVLVMTEEAFSLCNPKVIEMIDNIPLLEMDIVWCYFMLRDISWLSLAGVRLAKARKGFERSHGKDSTRIRLLQAGRQTEAAIYLRLELLEGVVAYHSGHLEESRRSLTSAQARYMQLQVPDEALSLLMGMGYREQTAKRALRMTNQDVQSAVDLLEEERDKKIRRRQENLQRQAEILEQQKYGTTPQRRPVDLQQLNALESIGFERNLAAEALRVNENDTQKALDDLTNPEKNARLQVRVEKRRQREVARPREEDIEILVSMGFDRSRVVDALHGSLTREEAITVLTAAASTDNNPGNSTVPSMGNSQLDAGSSSRSEHVHDNNNLPQDVEENGTLGAAGAEERDEEMEREIADQLTGDSLADYDTEAAEEGEAISEYLALLDSSN